MELILSKLILLLFVILGALGIDLISVLDLLSDLSFTIERMHVRLSKNLSNLILNLLIIGVIIETVLLVCCRVKMHIL